MPTLPPAWRTPAATTRRDAAPGAVCIGVGWAISGGCPAIPIIQVGSGYLPALVSIAGVVVGMRACRLGRQPLPAGGPRLLRLTGGPAAVVPPGCREENTVDEAGRRR